MKMKIQKWLWNFPVMLIMIGLMFGCGGGGGSSSGGSNPIAAPKTYSFYTATPSGYYQAPGSETIYAVDPDNPTSQKNIDSNVLQAFLVEAGNFNPSTKNVDQVYTRGIVYANYSTGKIYKVSALKSDNLASAQVSNESTAFNACQGFLDEDYSDVNKSQILYSFPGPDGQCNTSDDAWKMVKVGMSASDTPINLSATPEFPLYDRSTGAMAGWIGQDPINGTLLKCDVNMSNCVSIAGTSGTNLIERFGFDPNTSRDALVIDNTIRMYNWTANSLSDPIYTCANGCGSSGAQENSAVYFSDGSKVLKLDMSNNSASLIIDESPYVIFGNIWISNDKLVYLTYQPDYYNTELCVVPKNGGTKNVLASSDSWLWIDAINGNSIYYDSYNSSQYTTGFVLNNGSKKQELLGSEWAGAIQPSIISAKQIAPDKILRIDGCNSYNCENGTLKSFDASNYGNEIDIGKIPSDIDYVYAYGNNNNVLGVGGSYTSYYQSDVFYLNDVKANSLVRLTATPSIDEYPLSYY